MSDTAPEDTAAFLNRLRMTVYLLLSRTFSRELDEAALRSIEQVSGSLEGVWEATGLSSDPDISQGQSLLKSFFAGIPVSRCALTVEELARDYASLFLGVGPKTVSPCESVYRSRSELLFQDSYFEAQQAYRSIGMAKKDDYSEPEDHIAVELSFMARLCEVAQESLEKDRPKTLPYVEMQREFLEEHLIQWISPFAQAIIAAAGSGFYRGIAQLLRGYVRMDRQLIETMIQELNPRPKERRSQAPGKERKRNKE
jgi:putative dimethyl sulfoxide reductase chaperone